MVGYGDWFGRSAKAAQFVCTWAAVVPLAAGAVAAGPAWAATRIVAQVAQITPGGTIQQIRVEGTLRIDPETVRTYLGLAPGDPFDPYRIDQALKTLFQTGLFADVTVAREGDVLAVRVTENPIINRIAFEGNHKIEEKTLQDEVQLKPRVVYTRTKVQTDVRRILDLYRRNGRFGATVEPKIVELPQNRVDLIFEINEGARTGIERINFIGNKVFDESELRSTLLTKESRWYRILSNSDSYDPDRVTADREQLRRFYLSNGYADFRVLSSVAELSPAKDGFYLTFTVEEGERYKFGKVDVVSSIKDVPSDSLKALIQGHDGEWYNADQVEQTGKLITETVGNAGYAFVEVEPVITRDAAAHTIGVTYQVREGPRVYVERIDITGNVRTLDRVIRREFRLAEGDAFNTAKLRRSQQNLNNLNFFKKVDISNLPGSAPDRTIVKVNVEEQSTGELSIAGGYSTTDGPLGQVTIRERNLLGRAQDLQVSTTIAGRRQQFDISFTEPYFLDKNVSAGIDLFRIQRDLTDTSSYNYNSTGLHPRLGYQLTENLRQTLSYTARNDSVTNIQPGASRFVIEQKGTRFTSMVSQDLFYDRLDNRLDPTDGYYLSGGTDFAGIGGQSRYARVHTRDAIYVPLATGYVLDLNAEAGYIGGFGQPVRINDRFYPGGDNFPGFREGGFGPKDIVANDALGSKIYAIAGVELSFPLGLPKELGISGRVFNKVGIATRTDDKGPEVRDSGTPRAAAGVGVSWKSPFGPIRIDLGIPYIKKRFDKTENFRFGLGTQF